MSRDYRCLKSQTWTMIKKAQQVRTSYNGSLVNIVVLF
jgi:hypothetical protein